VTALKNEDCPFKLRSIIQYHDDEGNVVVIRVLLMHRAEDYLYAIRLYVHKPFPEEWSISNLEDLINSGKGQVIKIDPYEYLQTIFEERITPGRKKRRDKAWEIIRPLIKKENGDENLDIYYSNLRGKLIENRAKECSLSGKKKISENTILFYLRMYWQRGLVKNSLLNGYDKCGKTEEGRKYSSKPGNISDSERDAGTHEHIGIIITKEIEGYFEKAIDKNLGELSLERIFLEKVLGRYFSIGKDKNGRPQLLPDSMLPTKRQFNYVYEKLMSDNPEKYLKLKEGIRHFNLKNRPITGYSFLHAPFPGSLFQVDSTPLAYNIVSSFNPDWIIGGQFLYTVMDVCTDLWVASTLSFTQGWAAAMFALLVAFTNKKDYFKRYGIDLKPEDVPADGLCKFMIGDHASEWDGFNSDNVTRLGVEMANPEAYRPDLKAKVERQLGYVQDELDGYPGMVRYPKERGDKDNRLDASINKYYLTNMILRHQIYFNRNHILEEYPMSFEMISERVQRTPCNLWKWGVTNLGGVLSTYSYEAVRLNLLPQGKGSITPEGVYFDGRKYDCPTALNDYLMLQARIKGTISIVISFVPNDPDVIYVQLPNGKMEECHLNPKDKAFKYVDWDDIHDYERMNSQDIKSLESVGQQEKLNLITEDNVVIKSSLKNARRSRKGMSKRQQLLHVREHREIERQKEIAEENQKRHSVRKKHGMDNEKKPLEIPYIGPPNYADEMKDIVDRGSGNG
jgi:putative transposase